MPLKDIELKLRDEAGFGRSAHERSAQDSEYHVDVNALIEEFCVISVAGTSILGGAKVVSMARLCAYHVRFPCFEQAISSLTDLSGARTTFAS